MPPFQKIDKDVLVKRFAKYIKKKKALSSVTCLEFFSDFGMRPAPQTCVDIFVLGHKNVIPYPMAKLPQSMLPLSSFKGVMFFDHEHKMAYFTELSDIVIIKLLGEEEVKKIIE